MTFLKFDQLSDRAKQEAIDYHARVLINLIIAGQLRFNDELNKDDLQARIDHCFEQSERDRTPWFVESYLHEDEYVMESIQGMATCDAEDALYEVRGDELYIVETRPIASGVKL